MGIRQLETALAEIDRQLKEATLYAVEFNRGWDRVGELQALREAYAEALGQPKADALEELALAA